MSGAELKVQMTGLGLPAAWLAAQLGINTRTVIRWFDLDVVPTKAVAEIKRVSAITTTEMHRIFGAMYDDRVLYTLRTDWEGGHNVSPLPASWHRALTYRVLEYARSQGAEVTVAYAS